VVGGCGLGRFRFPCEFIGVTEAPVVVFRSEVAEASIIIFRSPRNRAFLSKNELVIFLSKERRTYQVFERFERAVEIGPVSG